MIGIELTLTTDKDLEEVKGTKSNIVCDFNCGGMYRAAVGKDGKAVIRV